MYARRDSVVCSIWISVFLSACFQHRVTSDTFDIQCTWPAFNCKAKDSQKSFALSRELKKANGLFVCSNLQWACRNGQCIAASSRCNGMTNCKDGSDELDCQGVGLRQDTGLTRLMTSQLAAKRKSRDSNKDNCTVHISPTHEQFCRRRYRGYYRHPFNCEKYVVCEWGEYHECQCPPLTRWDMGIVACIWKYMSPCLSRDPSTSTTQLPASQIARLIEIFAKSQYQLNRQKQGQKVQTSQSSFLPRMREVNTVLSKRMGIPVSTRNVGKGNTLLGSFGSIAH